MRSHLIFGALKPVRNRYMLCQLVSKATRKFHRPATRVQDTMNDVLNRFASSSDPARVMEASERFAEVTRQAA
ncbi:MAG: DNA-directed RNA polymerase subunit omega [Acidobacteriales bacterium]|nr:DNA-directed RNA polymerase subunit omega [Terriglobales bacterium]